MAVKAQPEGYHTVTPYLVVEGAAKLLDFTKQAFGAQEKVRMDGPNGRLDHAEIQIGDSIVMLADSMPEDPNHPIPAMIHLYVDDADKTFRQAIEAGANSIRELKDEFYGDRSGGVKDSFGNIWWIATHVEDVPPEEMERRVKEQQQ